MQEAPWRGLERSWEGLGSVLGGLRAVKVCVDGVNPSVTGAAWRDARPCSRLRLSGVCRIGQSLAVIQHALLPSARGRRIQARRAGPRRRPNSDILHAL